MALSPVFRPIPVLSALLLCLNGAPQGQEFSLNRNESHLDWRTAETPHFRFHYDRELEAVTEYVAGIAERVAAEKLPRYNLHFDGKTEFIVRDDIFSNGWANAFQNTMNIWVTDWDLPFRSTHHWLKDVIAHEFSHLVSIQSGSKGPSCIHGLISGYQDYYNEPIQNGFSLIVPFTHQPNWFAEGVAQYESQLSGFDAWDSHRDMIVRIAVLEGGLLNLGRMSSFTGTALQMEQGPYTQGYSFVRYLAGKYGDQAVLALWREHSRAHRQDFSASMERVLGKPADEIWKEWRSGLTLAYSEQVTKLGEQVYGKKLTEKSFYNYYPRWGGKGEDLYFISNKGSYSFRSSLYRYSFADSIKEEKKRLEFVSASVGGYFDIAPDESTFVFSSARHKDPEGRRKRDIYQQNLKQKPKLLSFGDPPSLKRFTRHLNAVDPDYNRAGDAVTFVRAHNSNFYLCTAPVPEAEELDADEVVTLFPDEEKMGQTFGFNVYTPKFSPDGQRIAFSFYDGISRKLGLISRDGKDFEAILDRPFDDRDPEWSADGRYLYFSSDSTGIYNIYRIELASREIQGLTNVAGGAFSPAVSPDGTRLAYVGYDREGFSLYLLDTLRILDLRRPAVHRDRDGNKVELVDLAGHSRPYFALPNRFLLNPIVFGQEMSATSREAEEGRRSWLAGISAFFNDPVHKNELSGGGLFELGKGIDYFFSETEIIDPDKESELFLSYRNHMLPISLGVSVGRRNVVTRDTATIQSRNLEDDDKVESQKYAITLQSYELNATYDLFDAAAVSDWDKSSFLHMATGYATSGFKFYDLQFPIIDFYQTVYLNGSLQYFQPAFTRKAFAAPTGISGFLSYTASRPELIRNGTFRETFVFDENGIIRANRRAYILQETDLGLSYGLTPPWQKNASAVVTGFASSILNWRSLDASPSLDTLDSYFEKGMFLRGYPLLRDIEHLTFQGENVVQLSFDYLQPLWNDIYSTNWILFVEDLYAHFFWDAGRAWDGKLTNLKLADEQYWGPEAHRDGWHQSVGAGIRLHNRVFHNYPLVFYLEGAYALNPIVVDSLGTLADVEPISLPLVGEVPITRLQLGFSLGIGTGFFGRGPQEARTSFRPELRLPRMIPRPSAASAPRRPARGPQ